MLGLEHRHRVCSERPCSVWCRDVLLLTASFENKLSMFVHIIRFTLDRLDIKYTSTPEENISEG